MADDLKPVGWGGGIRPGANVLSELASVNLGTNNVLSPNVWVFKDTTTDLHLFGGFEIPSNYVSGPILEVVWATTVTTGTARWGVIYKTVPVGESMDPAAGETPVEINSAAAATARDQIRASLSLNATHFATGRYCLFDFYREGSDTGNDDLAASAYVFDLLFKYQNA